MSTTAPRHTDETGDNAYGISIFAGVLLAMLGGFHILQGLSAVLKDDIFVKGADYTYKIDLTTWGWITMLLGAIAVLVGIGILKGQVRLGACPEVDQERGWRGIHRDQSGEAHQHERLRAEVGPLDGGRRHLKDGVQ